MEALKDGPRVLEMWEDQLLSAIRTLPPELRQKFAGIARDLISMYPTDRLKYPPGKGRL